MSLFPFPAELIELHEAELVQPAPSLIHAVEAHGKASLRLEGVYPGARGESLFLVVRLWAYEQPYPHIAGGTDRPVPVEHRFQTLGVLEADRLSDMLDHLGHVERDDEAALEIITKE